MIGQILQASPELMPLIGPTYFQFQDFPGSKELGEILKKVRDQQYPLLAQGEDGKPTPEQLQAQLSAMQAQGQQMQQVLQQAMQQIQTKQVEQDGKFKIAEMQAATDLRLKNLDLQLQAMKDATVITGHQIDAETKGLQMQTEAQNEAQALALDHAHENEQAKQQRAHEVAMAAAGGNTMNQTVEQGQDGEQENAQEQNQGMSQETGQEQSTPPATGATQE